MVEMIGDSGCLNTISMGLILPMQCQDSHRIHHLERLTSTMGLKPSTYVRLMVVHWMFYQHQGDKNIPIYVAIYVPSKCKYFIVSFDRIDDNPPNVGKRPMLVVLKYQTCRFKTIKDVDLNILFNRQPEMDV